MTITEIARDKRCVPGAKIQRESCAFISVIDDDGCFPKTHLEHAIADDWQFVSTPKSRRDEILELCDGWEEGDPDPQYGRVVDLIRAELAESGAGPKFQCGDRVMVSADGHIGRVTMTSIVYKLDNRLGAWNEMELRRAD